MAYAGELCDAGWNVLFFPEGERTVDGRWAPFREGTGILVKNLQVPLLPVAIQGGGKDSPPGRGVAQAGGGQDGHRPAVHGDGGIPRRNHPAC